MLRADRRRDELYEASRSIEWPSLDPLPSDPLRRSIELMLRDRVRSQLTEFLIEGTLAITPELERLLRELMTE